MGTPLAGGLLCRMPGMGVWVPVSADEVNYQIKNEQCRCIQVCMVVSPDVCGTPCDG